MKSEEMENNYEIIARAVIVKEGKILFCNKKGQSYYFLPGGHVEWKELAEEGLKREISEELRGNIKNLHFIGVVENIYNDEIGEHHELNLVFEAESEDISDLSKENQLDFSWRDIKFLSKENILPLALKKALVGWIENKKVFWASQIE